MRALSTSSGGSFEPIHAAASSLEARGAKQRPPPERRQLAPVLDELGAAGQPEPAPDGGSPADPDPEEEREERFSRAELDAAVAAASEEAARKAAAEAREEMRAAGEQRLANAAAAMVPILERAVGLRRECLDRAGADLDLALAIARQVVPHAVRAAPMADVEAMLADLVGRLVGQTRLQLRLPPDLVEDGRRLLQEVAGKAGFDGEHEVVGDDRLEVGDASLHWDHGAGERRIGPVLDEIESRLRERHPRGGEAEPGNGEERPMEERSEG